MASLALLPVALGTATARFTPSRFTACRSVGRRKLLMFGFPMIAVEDIILGLCEKGVAGWVSRANAVGDDDGTNLDDDDDDAEESLQATIEKSKKVIEMQQDLLKEIVERRKLVSSIKNSIVSTDEQVDSTESTKNSSEYDFPNLEEEVLGLSRSNGASSEDYAGTSTFESKKVQDRDFSGNINVEDSFTGLSSGVTSSGGSSTGNLFETNQWGPLSMMNPKTAKVYTPKKEYVEELATKTNGEGKFSADVEGVYAKPPPLAGINVLNIILIAAECAPWSKTGGLGDVAGALPKALARRGHRVMVVSPRYGDYLEAQDTGVRKRYMVDGQDMEVIYYQAYVDGVDFVFIDSPLFRHRGSDIYGGNWSDVLKRMVLFSKVAVEVCWHVPCGGVCYGDGNLVYIANDWHTALLPVYLQAYYRDNGLMKYTRSILVIHNISHQGRGPVDDFKYVDLPAHYKDLFTLYDPVGGEHFNIFAAGLKTADRIVTVSHGYAWEIKTSEGGWGLHSIINESDWKLRGIVNGIDTKEWHPEYDAYLKSDGYTNYSLETLDTGKAQCKAALQKELGLPVRPDVPLIGFIGRLDHQKGVDLIADAIPWMMGQDVQLVMLGSGKADLEQMLRQFESQHDDKVRGWVGFSVKTAHRITAGVDILLMPSRFEPCGLNQLYAMMYGTIPVVHAVGGLRDTVKPFDPYNESGYGWTFDRAEANVLIHALGNCLLTFREYKNSWTGLQRRGMSQDLSWDNAAQQYEDVLIAAKYQW